MKIFWLISSMAIALGVGYFLITQKENVPKTPAQIGIIKPTPTPQPTDITASFEIITLGTGRVFTASMYHNLSSDVYISMENPSQVHVKKEGITWTQFFKTLPMSLDKDCLTTGTGQTFCTNDAQTLKFYINDIENLNALDEVIEEGDHLLVTYD